MGLDPCGDNCQHGTSPKLKMSTWDQSQVQWWRRYLIVWLWMQISLPIIYQMTNPIPPMESPGNSASDGGVTCPNWLDISKVIEKRKMWFFFHSSQPKIDMYIYNQSQQLEEESGEAFSQQHEKEGPGPGEWRHSQSFWRLHQVLVLRHEGHCRWGWDFYRSCSSWCWSSLGWPSSSGQHQSGFSWEQV